MVVGVKPSPWRNCALGARTWSDHHELTSSSLSKNGSQRNVDKGLARLLWVVVGLDSHRRPCRPQRESWIPTAAAPSIPREPWIPIATHRCPAVPMVTWIPTASPAVPREAWIACLLACVCARLHVRTCASNYDCSRVREGLCVGVA